MKLAVLAARVHLAGQVAQQGTIECASREAGIEDARYLSGGNAIEIPVKLKVHDSVFVPLAKWPMLIAGNYRCIRKDEMITIRDAVHGNVVESRTIYEWVVRLCIGLGAEAGDLVPFEKYA